MQQVARHTRHRELHIEVNYSCNKLLNWRFNYTEQSVVKFHRTFCHSTSSRSVQLVARLNHARNVIYPFRIFSISCNKLHDQTTQGTLFSPFGYSRFRATSCTLHMKLWITHRSQSFVQQVVHYAWNHKLRIKVYLPITTKCGEISPHFVVIPYLVPPIIPNERHSMESLTPRFELINQTVGWAVVAFYFIVGDQFR